MTTAARTADCALAFDGTNAMVVSPYNFPVASSFSVSLWRRKAVGDAHNSIVFNYANSGSLREFRIHSDQAFAMNRRLDSVASTRAALRTLSCLLRMRLVARAATATVAAAAVLSVGAEFIDGLLFAQPACGSMWWARCSTRPAACACTWTASWWRAASAPTTRPSVPTVAWSSDKVGPSDYPESHAAGMLIASVS